MEQEQSNFLFGRKVTGKVAAGFGIVFCIALTLFIVGVYFGFEPTLTVVIFVAIVNFLTTFIWILGSINDKRELMLAALIAWGTCLNIWLGYMFLITIQIIPYGPELYKKYTHAEIAIPSITVLFVLFFIIMMLIYKAMGKDIRKLFRMNWQMYGIISGWALIALSIGQTLLFYQQRYQSDFYYYGTILYIVLNIVAGISFLFGIAKTKSMFVLFALVCWVVPLAIWIGLIIYGITDKGYNPGTRKKGYNPIYSISVFYMVLYVTICCAFKTMISNDGYNTERFDVAYAPPPTASTKLDV